MKEQHGTYSCHRKHGYLRLWSRTLGIHRPHRNHQMMMHRTRHPAICWMEKNVYNHIKVSLRPPWMSTHSSTSVKHLQLQITPKIHNHPQHLPLTVDSVIAHSTDRKIFSGIRKQIQPIVSSFKSPKPKFGNACFAETGSNRRGQMHGNGIWRRSILLKYAF